MWALLFSPLWGTLFLSFGLGPVLMRTDALAPLLGNTAAFLATVAAVGVAPEAARAAGLLPAPPPGDRGGGGDGE